MCRFLFRSPRRVAVQTRQGAARTAEKDAAVQCVILAGGLGTRMKARLDHLPKYLVGVAGKPFAHHQLAWAACHGVTHVVLCIGHMGDQIRAFVGDGAPWGLHVRYVEDGSRPLGTGGALRRAFDEGVLDERFVLQYGDSYLPFDSRAFFDAFSDCGMPAMMTVYRNEARPEMNNVEFSDGRVRVYDKSTGRRPMAWIDYGMTGFDRALVAERVPPGQFCDLSDVTRDLSLEGRLAGFEVTVPFHEVGSPEGLAELEQWFGGRRA